MLFLLLLLKVETRAHEGVWFILAPKPRAYIQVSSWVGGEGGPGIRQAASERPLPGHSCGQGGGHCCSRISQGCLATGITWGIIKSTDSWPPALHIHPGGLGGAWESMFIKHSGRVVKASSFGGHWPPSSFCSGNSQVPKRGWGLALVAQACLGCPEGRVTRAG